MKKKSKRNSVENLDLKIINYPIYPHLRNYIDSRPRKNSLHHTPKISKHLSRFTNISQDRVIKILSKEKKLRIDMENRIVADYLTDHFSYFSQIKESSREKFLKLISVLNLETIPSNQTIINIGEENNNFYIIFEGSVIVYRQYKYKKDMIFSEFCRYLRTVKLQNKEDYYNIIKNNSHLDLNFEAILEDEYFYLRLKNKIFNFYVEELEEIGTYSEGFSFGELSLINKKNNDIIIKSISKCKLISVSKFDFNRILRTIEEKRIEKKADIFKINFPLFKSWSMEQLITLFNYCSQVIFQNEEFIYKQNDESEYIYFIEEGTLLQYANVSFSWYLEFIEYIKNGNNNLLEIIKNFSNNKKFCNNYKSADFQSTLFNLIKKIRLENNNKKNLEKYNFLNINEIYMQRKKDLIKISNLYSRDKVIKNNENFFKIKFQEDDINNPETIYKIIINTFEIPCIIGLEEIFELKKRFTTIACISGQIRAKKIKIIDLLRILFHYREFDYINNFLEIILQKKTILCEAIRINLQNIGKKFENIMNDKYEKLTTKPKITSYKNKKSNSYNNKVENEILIATKLKSWNSGSYLDNILDNSLHLLNPKSQRQIDIERREKNKKLNILLKKPSSNEKILLSTKNYFSKILLKRPLNLLKNKKIKLKTLDKKDMTIKKDRYINNLFRTSLFPKKKIDKSRNIKTIFEEKKNGNTYIKTFNNYIIKNNKISLTERPNNLKKDILGNQKGKVNYVKSFKDYKNYKISESDFEKIKDNNDNDTNSLSFYSKEKETENLPSVISTNDKEKNKLKNFLNDNDLIKRNLSLNIIIKEKLANLMK